MDWGQATNIGKSLLFSPMVGFVVRLLLLVAVKAVIKNRALYEAPEGTEPPPFWIRALLVLTCTGVSFAHGSNDGQKGMGLIMLILIGTVPTAYALNHAITAQGFRRFHCRVAAGRRCLSKYVSPNAVIGDAREDVKDYVRTKEFTPNTMLALRQLVNDIGNEMANVRRTGAGSERPGAQLPQRHVSRQRGAAADEEDRQPAISAPIGKCWTTTRSTSTRPPSLFRRG